MHVLTMEQWWPQNCWKSCTTLKSYNNPCVHVQDTPHSVRQVWFRKEWMDGRGANRFTTIKKNMATDGGWEKDGDMYVRKDRGKSFKVT